MPPDPPHLLTILCILVSVFLRSPCTSSSLYLQQMCRTQWISAQNGVGARSSTTFRCTSGWAASWRSPRWSTSAQGSSRPFALPRTSGSTAASTSDEHPSGLHIPWCRYPPAALRWRPRGGDHRQPARGDGGRPRSVWRKRGVSTHHKS